MLVLLALAPFLPALLGGEILVHRDHFAHFLPKRWLLTQVLDAAASPLWNPYQGVGVPFAADPQAGLFYPPALLLFGLLPFTAAFDLYPALHLALAGTGIYTLLRFRGLGRGAALFGGVAFQLSGFMLSITDLQNFLASLAWLPWAAAAAHRAGTGTRRVLWSVLAGVFLALTFLAGEPVVAVTAAVLAACTVSARTAESAEAGHRLRTGIQALVVMALTAAGLAAAQALPFLEWALASLRATGIPLEEAGHRSLRGVDLLGFLAPLPFEGPGGSRWGGSQDLLASLYLGWGVLLVLVQLEARRLRRLWPWLVLAGVGVLLALGSSLPFYPRLHALGLDVVRYPARFLFLTALSVAVLAGHGWAALAQRSAEGRTSLLRTAAVPVAAFVLALLAWWATPGHWPDGIRQGLAFGIGRGALFAALAAGVLLAVRRTPLTSRHALLLVGLLVAADLGLFVRPGFRSAPLHALLSPPPPVVPHLEKLEGPPARVLCLESLARREAFADEVAPNETRGSRIRLAFLPPGGSILFGVAEVSREPVLPPLVYEPVHEALHDRRNIGLASFMGVLVRIAVTRTRRGPSLFYEPVQADPRPIRIVGPTGASVDPSEALRFGPDEPRDLPLPPRAFELAPALEAGTRCADAAGFELERWSPTSLEIDVTVPCPAVLVHTTTWWPGWRATIDGEPAELFPVLGAFQGLVLPEGEHEVVLRYRPASLLWGGILTGATLLLLAVAAVLSLFGGKEV